MEYTTYLSQLVATSGTPHSESDALRIVMNIVHLEGKRAALISINKKSHHNSEMQATCFRELMKIQEKIDTLTIHMKPKDFYSRLLKYSQVGK